MELTKEQLINACISFQYNYELLSPGKQRVLREKASRWFIAFQDSVTPIDHDEKIQVEEARKELWAMFGDTEHAVELASITGKLYRITHRK